MNKRGKWFEKYIDIHNIQKDRKTDREKDVIIDRQNKNLIYFNSNNEILLILDYLM